MHGEHRKRKFIT